MLFLGSFISIIWILFAYFQLILHFHRLKMAKLFIPQDIYHHSQYRLALSRMFKRGAQFDAKVIAIMLAPFFLIGAILLPFINVSMIALSGSIYIFIFAFILIGVVLGNFYYFKTYNNYYDMFMFGLVEDDTKAVLKNIYDDYPVISGFIATFGLAILPATFVFYALPYQYVVLNGWILSLFFIITLCSLAFAARGTIFSVPLGKNHAQVSSLSIINKMVPNGIIAMEWAFSDRKRNIRFEPVDLKEGEHLMQQALGVTSLIAQTDENKKLAACKPNVFLAVMESFGANYLVLDNLQDNDLLGSLRPHFEKDIVFKRFLSDYNGTAPTLASLYFYSPIQNISQSIAQQTVLPYSPFFTYKKQGYRTIFITSGGMMWRNLGNYLPLQGIDECYDQNDIMEAFPEAKETLSYWGVADEYGFALAEKLLLEAEEPVFINFLSMTNHPPYEVPKHYPIERINPASLQDKFGSEKECRDSLATYQYANNALGNFISKVTCSEKGANTLIAATGDHHVRGVRIDAPKENFIAFSVPFYIHLPESVKDAVDMCFDPNRIGSHKDIMPTLYSLTLSNSAYWHLGGRNLLAKQDIENFAFAFNEELWADKEGVMEGDTQFSWQNSTALYPENLWLHQATPLSKEKQQRISAYRNLLHWQINYLVAGSK